MENRRQKLLEVLSKNHGWMTSRQLAAILEVTDRTIRSDVKWLNENYQGTRIESNIQKGYRVIPGKDTGQFQREDSAGKRSDVQVPQTSEARCIYIIQRLLFEVKELNLLKLQEQIFVSEYTIERDIKRIRKMLKSYSSLKLVRNGMCIRLTGDELSKRKLYKNLLAAEVEKDFLNLNQLAALYEDFDLLEVKDIFLSVIEEYGYPIRESLLFMVILHAGTSIERMLHSNFIQEENGDSLKDTIEYQISSEFFKRIADRLHIHVEDSEINRFAIVIMGRRTAGYNSDYILFKGEWVNTKALTQEAVLKLYEVFGIDFREDRDLIIGLNAHLHGLLERETNHVCLENIFMDEIQNKYPLIFEMGVFTTEYLEKKLNTGIAGTESAYIALHLGAASERLKSRSRYRAVAILPYNQSFSTACITKLSEMFHEKMELVKTLHYYEESVVRELEPDLLLTACPIHHSLDITTVPINLFVDFDTESNILKALNELDKKTFRLKFLSGILRLIRREHYYECLDCSSPTEIIRILCRKMEEEGVVDASFCDIVLKREKMSPTSFVDTFAIPHAFGHSARESTIAVAHLKHPVRWGEFHVKLVMLFAVNENDQQIIKVFFDWISSLVNDRNRLAELCVPMTYDQFVDKIIE